MSASKLLVIIDRDVCRVFRARDDCESLVPVSHLGMSCGYARVGSTATHRSFTSLALREIETFVFISHCSRRNASRRLIDAGRAA